MKPDDPGDFYRFSSFRRLSMKLKSIFLLIPALLMTACSPFQGTPAPASLVVMTHDSFSVSTDLITEFEQTNHVKVTFLKSGDAGAALNKAILSRNAPLADVFYGVDNTFLSRALQAEIFIPYSADGLRDIPGEFILDPNYNLLPVDYGDVCINFDKAYFLSHDLSSPHSFEDLLRPDYQDLLVMENPSTSSTGLAFLLATIAYFGEDGYKEYWAGLRSNGLVVVNDWSTAYYANFSGSSGHGAQPLVVSYASSPAAEVVYAETKLSEAPIGSMVTAGTCFRQIEFVGILKGTQQLQLAQKFIDFMLGVDFQQDMPLQMFVYPLNSRAEPPPEFTLFADVAEEPASLSPAEIASHRDAWIAEWVKVVLH
jgi:thiamine transport system substrate-binding protein